MNHDSLGFMATLIALLCAFGMSAQMECWAEDKVVTEFVLTDFRDSAAWRITSLRGDIGNSNLQNGVLTCDFTAQPGYVGIGGGLGFIPGAPEEVVLTFASNTSGHPVVLRFGDSDGQYFQREVARLDCDGMQTVRVPLADMGSWFHFGGTNDGVVRLPIRLSEIIIDRNGPNTSVRLIELKARTDIPVDQGIEFKLVSRKREQASDVLCIQCRNILPSKVKARYSWRVTDFFGKVLGTGTQNLTLPPSVTVERNLRVARSGVKLCEFRLQAQVPMNSLSGGPPKPLSARPGLQSVAGSDIVLVTKVIPTSVVELSHGGSSKLLPDSPFGMGIYLGQRWPSSGMETPAQIAQDIGVKWMRDEFNWGRIERVKGEWNWESFDVSVQTATQHGISIFGLLCYWSPWAKPHTEEGIGDYCNYVREVVSRYKDHIKYWEIWNEPNIFFWTGTIEQYATLTKAAYDAVKEADPEAKVIGCCTAGTDLNFIEKVFQFGGFDKMDILSIHPYRYPPTPEETDFIGVIKRADALVRKYGAPKEIWITEIGWPTNIGGNGSSEAKQAAMIARTYMQAMASGVVQKAFWYDFRNDGLDPNYNEHNFGIIRQDQSVKPACIAFRTMTQRLEGKKFVKALDVPSGVCTYVFESKTARTLAAWCVTGTATLAISGTFPSITVTNLIGQRSVAKLVNGRASVRISQNPVFIDGIPANSKVAAQSVKPARSVASEEAPVRISASSLGASRFAVEIVPLGLLKTVARVTVRIPGYVDTFKLPAGKAAHREEYAIPEGLSLDPTKGVLVSVIADTGTDIVSKRSKVQYVECRRAPRDAKLNGDLGKWNLGDPIRIGEIGHTQALDPGKWSGPDDLSAHVWTAWDETSFYILAKVTDDVFHQGKTGGDIWQGDSLQFALDPLHLEARGPGDVYEIGIALTPKGPQIYSWLAPAGRNTGLIESAKLVVKREGKLTIYQARIPLSELAPLKPKPGKTVGFALVLNDDDGEGRKGWLEWNSGVAMEKTPYLYGDITFTD